MKFKNKNNPIELRPKCKIIDIDMSKEDIIKKINDNLITGNNIAVGSYDETENHFELKIPSSQRHFWSPKLLIWIDEQDNKKASISCIFSPDYKIWNLFLVLYIISFVFIIAGVIFTIYQKLTGQNTDYLWTIPLGLLLVLLINMAARIGQYWGRTQVDQLKSFVSMIIDQKI